MTDLGKKYAKYKITTNYHEESKWNAGFRGESKSNSKFSLVFCIYRVGDPFAFFQNCFFFPVMVVRQSKVPLEPYNSHKISHIPCLPHCFFFLISFQLIIYLLSLNSKSRQLNIKRIYEFLSVRKRVIFSICPFSIRAFLAIFWQFSIGKKS